MNSDQMPLSRVNSDSDVKSDSKAQAIHLVQNFLRAIKGREMDVTQSFLAPEFRIIVPGGATFRTLDEHIAWARTRYSNVTTTYEHFDATTTEQEVTVYCFGTLAGEWPDSTPFSSIRFIDRLVVRDRQLIELQIWNDMDTALLQYQQTSGSFNLFLLKDSPQYPEC
jgi:hypothetical protein